MKTILLQHSFLTWAWVDKTVTTLTAINNLMYDAFEIRKVLIIAPLRVARDTWSAEIEKWEHLQHLRYSVAIGTAAERKKAFEKDADIYLLNRECVDWAVSNTAFDFDMVVIDELSSFKNHQSKRFKALMKVRPRVKRIVGLTGTPAGNGLMDLFAEFKLLDMGERLGRYISQYRNNYFKPDKQNGYIVYSYKPLPDAEERIYDKISDITVSMKAIDHLKMPELITTQFVITMSDEEREKYKSLKDELVLQIKDTEITAANAASLSNKLCQMSNGAIYDDDNNIIPIHDRKLDALEDIIESANGKPVLVAYWFKHDRTRITERLSKLGVVYQEIKTAASIENWNKGKLQIALIQPQSCGHGLNIQAGGNILVWMSIPWSYELYSQTNARLWRQGQKSSTVVIQHIVTKGTVDERILKALETKDKTQTALMNAVKAELGGL